MAETYWWAIHSRAQKEEDAARDLRRRGFDVFWPYTSHWVATGHKDKSRLVKRSWLSRYLFIETPVSGLPDVAEGLRETRLGVLVYAPGNYPFPIADEVIKEMKAQADHLGEVFPENMTRKAARCKVGDVLRITDEKHPLFGFFVEAKKVLDSGAVHALIQGQLLGLEEIILTNPDVGEVVTQGAGTSDPQSAFGQ